MLVCVELKVMVIILKTMAMANLKSLVDEASAALQLPLDEVPLICTEKTFIDTTFQVEK